MRDIERIDGSQFLVAQSNLYRALHKVSDGIVRVPTIDHDANISTSWILDIDEEFGMSEWGDNHG
jgi:hypothetical protein